MLIIHIIIALSSLGFASFVYFKPTIKRLVVSYGFIGGTVATGTALLVLNPSNLLHTCLSGLFYLTIVSIVTIATHVRTHNVATERTEK